MSNTDKYFPDREPDLHVVKEVSAKDSGFGIGGENPRYWVEVKLWIDEMIINIDNGYYKEDGERKFGCGGRREWNGYWWPRGFNSKEWESLVADAMLLKASNE